MARSGGLTTATESRLDVLRRMHLEGASTADLRQHCITEWGVSQRTASRLLAEMRERLQSDWQRERPSLLAETMARAEHIYAEAVRGRNWPVAISAVRTMARIGGLDLPDPSSVMPAVLEVLEATPISPEARLCVHLALTARGLCTTPDLSTLPTPVLERLAAGRLMDDG